MKDVFDSLRSDPHLNIGILTDRRRDNHKNDPSWDWDKNEDVRLSPESIASVSDPSGTWQNRPDFCSQTYLFLVNQDRSAWGWEIDRKSEVMLIFSE